MKVMKIKLDVLGIVMMLLSTKVYSSHKSMDMLEAREGNMNELDVVELDKRSVHSYDESQFAVHVFEPAQEVVNSLLQG